MVPKHPKLTCMQVNDVRIKCMHKKTLIEQHRLSEQKKERQKQKQRLQGRFHQSHLMQT